VNTYGYSTYGSGPYGGFLPRPFISTIPITIEVYDYIGRLKQSYQSAACDLVSVDFAHAESGCKDFTLVFGSIKNITKNDHIKLKIFTSDKYFFTGVVRTIPIAGSTSSNYQYTGFGWNDYLQRLNTGNLSLGGHTVAYIVLYLLQHVLMANTLVTCNYAKIAPLTMSVTTCDFARVGLKDAFDALQNIANSDGSNYRYGVDETGDFFFMPHDTTVQTTLIAGKRGDNGIPKYEPKDSYEARTKYYVVRADGTYYGSVNTTVAGNDIYEEKLTAPEGLADADIGLWALGQMLDNQTTKRTASVDWKIKTYYPQLLTGDGYLRVISNIPPKRKPKALVSAPWNVGQWGNNGVWGGQQYEGYYIDDTLQIVEVKYKISAKEATRSITLGSRPITMESEILKIRQKLVDLAISLGK
jgi:hypothetical protein